jgi:hypothetical protein
MLVTRLAGSTLFLATLVFLTNACGGTYAPGGSTERRPAVDAPGLTAGQYAVLDQPGGSPVPGIAVRVRRLDGTTVWALFRGPTALARNATDGTFEFREDSLPARVRMLEPGQELRASSGSQL